jgi:hypothetical protein
MKVTLAPAGHTDMRVALHRLEDQLARERTERLRLETQLGAERSVVTKLRLALARARAELAGRPATAPPSA